MATIRVGNLDGTGATRPDRHARASPLRGGGRPCAGKIYWAEFVSVGTTAGTIRRANLDGSNRGDPGLRSVRPERGGDRPRSQQDLLDQPGPRRAQRRGLAREPERLESAGDCAAARPIRSGSRSTRPPARSTGPTSATAAAVPARSGSRTWTARRRHGPVRRRGRPGRGGDRPRGEQDLLGQFRPRHHPGREPERHGRRLDPVRRPELLALPRAAARPRARRASGDIRRSQGRRGNSPAARRAGRPTCSGRSCTGRRPTSPISGRGMGPTIAGANTDTFTPTVVRRLHLHRDGHQPGRVDLAD